MHDPSRCDTQDDGAEVLRSDLAGFGELQVDGDFVYRLFRGGGSDSPVLRVYRLEARPGGPQEEIATQSAYPSGFVQTADTLWWSTRARDVIAPGSDLTTWDLHRLPKSGGAPVTVIDGLVQYITGSPQGIVAARPPGPGCIDCERGTLELVPFDGSPARVLCRPSALGEIAANARAAYFAHYRAIEECTFDTAEHRVVASVTGADEAFAVDDTHAYWIPLLEAGMRRIPLAGGPVETLAGDVRVRSYRLSGNDVYFETEGTIQRMPKQGGAATVIVPEQSGIATWQLGPRHVYWMEGSPYEPLCFKRKAL